VGEFHNELFAFWIFTETVIVRINVSCCKRILMNEESGIPKRIPLFYLFFIARNIKTPHL